MISPRRTYPKGAWEIPKTPYDKFVFEGDGPFYEFEVWDTYYISAAAALNYFHNIGARVHKHESRSVCSKGGAANETTRYEYYLVEWRPKGRKKS